jgi:hypothetical protein
MLTQLSPNLNACRLAGCYSCAPNVVENELRSSEMSCTVCGSKDLDTFGGEIAIHFRGVQSIDKPQVFVFCELVVCVGCGVAQFTVPQAELHQLAPRAAAASG